MYTNIILEKNTKVLISPYSLHMDPQYYPEPMRFDPERFTLEEKTKRISGTFLPFGDGPHNCIGT